MIWFISTFFKWYIPWNPVMNPQQLPGVFFSSPQVAAGTAKSWVAKGDVERFSVRKLRLFTNRVWTSYNGDIPIYGIYWLNYIVYIDIWEYWYDGDILYQPYMNKILGFDEHSMNIFCDEAGVWFRVNYITAVRVTVSKSSHLSIWGW